MDRLKSIDRNQKRYAYLHNEEKVRIMENYLRTRKGIKDLHIAEEKKYLIPCSHMTKKNMDPNMIQQIDSM